MLSRSIAGTGAQRMVNRTHSLRTKFPFTVFFINAQHFGVTMCKPNMWHENTASMKRSDGLCLCLLSAPAKKSMKIK